uniref:Zinc finger CCHC domain-containing protein 7 n=1 Tax=Anopheles stephensi TaxID=30069 RepID=A0A182Y2S6_ANOST
MEDRDLAALEERLYSSIHHSYEDTQLAKIPDATQVPAPATRTVSRTTVVNNSQGILPANMKRYWVGSAAPSAGERAPYAKHNPTDSATKQSAPGANVSDTVKDGGGVVEIKKMFLTPYQSLLGNKDEVVSENQSPLPENTVRNQNVPERAAAPKHATKEPGLQLKKKKQTKQPGQYVEKRLASLLKLIDKDRKENAMQVLESKKTKANQVRQRKPAPVVVAEICINSSDEESQPVKRQDQPAATPLLLSDEEGDEVIIIPTPPPPQICIDCSDEEDASSSSQFAIRKSKNGKKQKLAPATSSRCHSPSNSSIMSDDFIGQHDRSRLNDSFTESIPSDDELASTMEGNRRSGTSGRPAKEAAEKRLERVPSISSEDTVGTNGDTTDQEKRPEETVKGNAGKSQPQANGIGTAINAKSKKETKKTPAKGKLSKSAPASPVVEAATSPSTTSKASDTSTVGKPSGKSKTRSKSPVSLVMELVRKQFDYKKTRSDGSGKKTKKKKDASAKDAGALSSSDKPSNDCAEKENAGKGGTLGTKGKSKKIPVIEENVSSESDYDISLKDASSTSTPQEPDRRLRRSASTFIEQEADVSSESDYDESFLQTKSPGPEKQTVEKEPKKRIGRKRKQYNSETYSDEDFACLLTDIVRAVSDTEEEEEEEDEDDEEEDETANVDAVRVTRTVSPKVSEAVASVAGNEPVSNDQPTSSKADRNPKKKRKVKNPPPAAAAAGCTVATTQPTDRIDEEEQQAQPEPGAKKRKKAKEPKASVKNVAAGGSCSTPEIARFEKATGPSEHVAPSPIVKRKKKQTTKGSVPTTPNYTLTITDSDDEDIQIVVSEPARDSERKTPTLGPDCAWNEEMKQFYNTSWAGENMDLEMALRKMPYDNRQWHIVNRDRFPEPPKKEITCSNCGERGHVKIKCRNAPKQAICYMCGEKGHREPRCPKTICLNCGAKTHSFVRGCKSCSRDADVICFLCGIRGHTQRSCPDLWRRYHSTTEDNVPLREGVEKNPKARWCSICGRAGHQAHTCNDARRIFGHPIPNVHVSSYMPAYRGEYNRYSKHQNDEQERRFAENPTARYNLFSDDANACEFNLPELAQNEKGFYFSFLRSTGLLEKHLQFSREQEEASRLLREQQQQVPAHPEPAPEAAAAIETSPHDPHPVAQIKEEEEETKSQPGEFEIMEQTVSNAKVCPQEPIDSNTPASDNVTIVEENSNYSFSEFHSDTFTEMHNFSDSIQRQVGDDALSPPTPTRPPADSVVVPTESNTQQQLQTWLSDYIPLTVADPVAETTPSPGPSPILPAASTPEPNLPPAASASEAAAIAPTATENAKVLLTKQHASQLLSEQGAKFLSSAGTRHGVQLSILFESVGNVLLITGAPEAQSAFHEQLVHYLRETEQAAANGKYLQNIVPKHSNKMTRYIAGYLRCLVREKDSVRLMLERLHQSTNAETQEKWRRKLNTHLLGVCGLRDGRKHLNMLRSQLALCMNANPWKGELEEYRRVIISDAIRYIFSGYDHKNYDALVEEFELLKRTNRLTMLTFYDLGIPRIITRPQTSEVSPKKQQGKGKKSGVGKPNSIVRAYQGKKPPKERMARQRDDLTVEPGVDSFIMNTTPFPTIDPIRLQQLDHSTRYAHHTAAPQERENGSYPDCAGKNWSQREWRRQESARDDRPRYQWFRQQEPTHSHRHQQGGADISRLGYRANTLREQELGQLQRIQDMLRR